MFGQISGGKELKDGFRNLLCVRFQREVSRIEELNARFRYVALEGFGAWRKEEWIMLAPYR